MLHFQVPGTYGFMSLVLTELQTSENWSLPVCKKDLITKGEIKGVSHFWFMWRRKGAFVKCIIL